MGNHFGFMQRRKTITNIEIEENLLSTAMEKKIVDGVEIERRRNIAFGSADELNDSLNKNSKVKVKTMNDKQTKGDLQDKLKLAKKKSAEEKKNYGLINGEVEEITEIGDDNALYKDMELNDEDYGLKLMTTEEKVQQFIDDKSDKYVDMAEYVTEYKTVSDFIMLKSGLRDYNNKLVKGSVEWYVFHKLVKDSFGVELSSILNANSEKELNIQGLKEEEVPKQVDSIRDDDNLDAVYDKLKTISNQRASAYFVKIKRILEQKDNVRYKDKLFKTITFKEMQTALKNDISEEAFLNEYLAKEKAAFQKVFDKAADEMATVMNNAEQITGLTLDELEEKHDMINALYYKYTDTYLDKDIKAHFNENYLTKCQQILNETMSIEKFKDKLYKERRQQKALYDKETNENDKQRHKEKVDALTKTIRTIEDIDDQYQELVQEWTEEEEKLYTEIYERLKFAVIKDVPDFDLGKWLKKEAELQQ